MFFHPRITYNDPNEDQGDSFLKYIANRIMNNNKNFLCAVTGQTGSGKSYLCGSIAEKLSELTGAKFIPKIHTVASIKDFLRLVNNADELAPPGTVIHFDEPQVGANARDWQSDSNRILSTITSTFRNKRLIVLFATPVLEFIDKQTRILFHSEIKVMGFDKTTNYTLCQPRFLEFIPKIQDFYRKRLVVEYKEKSKDIYSWYYLQDWEVHSPSKDWINFYEEMAKEFKDKIIQDLVNKEKGKEKDKEIDYNDMYLKIKGIYTEKGQNFEEVFKLFPNITLATIERFFKAIKTSENEQITKEKPKNKQKS